MESVAQDLRYAARALRRSPGYTLVAVAILALGIGANTLVFSVVNAVLLRPPLYVDRPEELVAIYTSDFSGPLYGGSSYPDYLDFLAGAPALADAVYYSMGPVAMAGDEGASKAYLAEFVTGNYFSMLGVDPVLGRSFSAEESDVASGASVAIVSHGLWERQFGSDPSILGRRLRLSGQDVTVIGVAPPGFGGSLPAVEPDFWIPWSTQVRMPRAEELENRGSRGPRIRARLAPGATPEEAQAQLDVVAKHLFETYPRQWSNVRDESRRVTVAPDSPVPPQFRGAAMGFAALLMAVVGLVLLIACANVASLTLARVSRRRREIAVRLSLGAARGRLVRQLFTESLLVAAAGGVAGAWLAYAGVRFAESWRPDVGVELVVDLGIDARVLLFTGLVTLVTVLAMGLVPALQASRPDLVRSLTKSARGVPPAGRRFSWLRLRNLLVICQIAASLVLLVSAGLFLKGLGAASAVDPGFNPENVAMMTLDLAQERYGDEEAAAFFTELVARTRSSAKVTRAALADRLPLAGGDQRRFVEVEGHEPASGEDMEFDFFIVSPGFFEVLEMPIVTGRPIADEDRPGRPPAVVVNRAFARRFWPGESPLGKRLTFASEPGEVVGVVRDADYRSLAEEPRPAFFVAAAQNPRSRMTLMARTSGDPAAFLPDLKAEVRALDSRLSFSRLTTLEEALADTVLPQRVASWVLAAAGGIGLLLASVGLYGLIAFLVSQRLHEIGVRMALGARAGDVVRLIVGQGVLLAGIGTAVGLGASFGVTRFLRSLLFGVSPVDPLVFATMALTAAGVAALASYLPARRAARVDPSTTLRIE